MFPVGGTGVMVLGAVVAGLVLAGLGSLLARRAAGPGPAVAWALVGLVWTLVVIALVTLIPADGAPGYVPADTRMAGCSFDYGGPAPDGFWIFGSGQRVLNTALFVPSGALVALLAGAVGRRRPASARRRRAVVVAIVVGLLLLVACSVGIEWTQLELARLDRACDVTDVVDNATGALLGALGGSAVVALAALAGAATGRRHRDLR